MQFSVGSVFFRAALWAFVVAACSTPATAISYSKPDAFLQLARSESVGFVLREWTWMAGILGTLFGATLTVTGLMAQKFSHSHVDSRQVRRPIPYWLEWYWLLGFALFLVGQVFCFLSLGLASQSTLACINCWNVIVVFVIAPTVLGERVCWKVLVSGLMLFAACVAVICCGPRDFQQHDASSIRLAWQNPVFLFLTVSIFFGATFGLVGMCVNLNEGSPIEGVRFGLLSAIVAWYGVLCSKCTSALTITSVSGGGSQLGEWCFWVFVICAAGLGVLQIHLLNLGLMRGSAVSVMPVYEAVSMTGQVVVIGIFFDEFRSFTWNHHLRFWAGVSWVIVSVVVLGYHSRRCEEGKEKEPALCAGAVVNADVSA